MNRWKTIKQNPPGRAIIDGQLGIFFLRMTAQRSTFSSLSAPNETEEGHKGTTPSREPCTKKRKQNKYEAHRKISRCSFVEKYKFRSPEKKVLSVGKTNSYVCSAQPHFEKRQPTQLAIHNHSAHPLQLFVRPHPLPLPAACIAKSQQQKVLTLSNDILLRCCDEKIPTSGEKLTAPPPEHRRSFANNPADSRRQNASRPETNIVLPFAPPPVPPRNFRENYAKPESYPLQVIVNSVQYSNCTSPPFPPSPIPLPRHAFPATSQRSVPRGCQKRPPSKSGTRNRPEIIVRYFPRERSESGF